MIIRAIKESDANTFLTLSRKLDEETSFMLYEPGERTMGVQDQVKMIRTVQKSGMIFVCEEGDELLGYILVDRKRLSRINHKAYIVIGILQAHRGKGIGAKLFEMAERWAVEEDIHRLELTVMTHNEVAIALYKKQGFQIEAQANIHWLLTGTMWTNTRWQSYSKIKRGGLKWRLSKQRY